MSSKKGLVVLSLFDGMSCGQLALRKAGIRYSEYYASEIDTHAISVASHNFPDTTHIGSVIDIDVDLLRRIDLLIGGSPCQSFSSCGDGSGFEGKSGLFWEYVRVLRESKPKYFLLENVVMRKEWEDVISEALGVSPILISSSLVSPQKRDRLYWTNIDVKPLKQRAYDIKDIIGGEGFASSCNQSRYFKKRDIFNTLTATYYKGIRACSRPAISTKEGYLDDDRKAHRMLTPEQCEKLQTVPVGYTSSASKTQRYKMLGNGWTVDVIAHIFKGLRG